METTEYPTPHGSSTFNPPAVDGSMLLPETFDYNGIENPKHTLFQFVRNQQLCEVTWADAKDAIHNVGNIVNSYLGSVARPSRNVIAILAVSDSSTYFTVICGLMRAGYIPFPISPRNSAAAVANLITTTGTKYVLLSSDNAMQELYKAAQKEINGVQTFSMPTYEQVYNTAPSPLPPLSKVNIDDTAVILHSSGSTAFPKPIALSFRFLLQAGLAPYYGEINLSKETLSSHAVPMFHLMGVVLIPFTALSGLTISVFAPQTPPVIPTPERVFTDATGTNSTLLFCAPLFLEAWSHNPEYVCKLKNFNVVIFAGGPLDSNIGDELIKKGVNLSALYGSTESGPLTVFLPKKPAPEGWAFWRLSSHVTPALIPFEGSEGVYRLVVLKTHTHTPAIINTHVDGQPALDTNDLVVLHPQNRNLFQVYGRSDDQIMHSTGEKTNPGPLETIMNKDPNVQAAIMFGRAEFNAGVIIMPKSVQVNISNMDEVAAYRNLIWSTVEKSNEFAPSHSKVFKEMIIVADPKKPFEYTPKGTLRRPHILEAYSTEIKKIYEAFKISTQGHILGPRTWTLTEAMDFVRCTVKSVMVADIADSDDIFLRGCDSLQATWIRNTLLRSLPLQVDGRKFSSNFVYTHPSITKLSIFLVQICDQRTWIPTLTASISQKCDEMRHLVDIYSRDVRDLSGEIPVPQDEVFLLTGTTGGLGCHVLGHLLQQPGATKVYCLTRPGTQSSLARHKAAFMRHGFNTSLLQSPKLILLDANLSEKNLGLDEDTYCDIKNSITTIIHIGWQVDFNVSLSTMEPLLQGVRNLADLALSTPFKFPPHFVFVSSQSVFTNWDKGTAPEAHIHDPQIAINSGYSESKWCAEEILQHVSIRTRLHPISVRVGQLSAGYNGYWNTKEWFPALVKSSQAIGSLPDIHGSISWVPMDTAALALIEMRTSQHSYFNLVNPKSISIEEVTSLLSAQLKLPLMSPEEWFNSVLEGTQDFEKNLSRIPALRLLEFFKQRLISGNEEISENLEALKFPKLTSDLAYKHCSALQVLNQRTMDSDDIGNWVRSWRSQGYLD